MDNKENLYQLIEVAGCRQNEWCSSVCWKFSPAFFKRRHGSNAVGRWSPSAEGEILFTAFLFVNFFFARPSCKEKVANAFVQFLFVLPLVYSLKPLSIDRGWLVELVIRLELTTWCHIALWANYELLREEDSYKENLYQLIEVDWWSWW